MRDRLQRGRERAMSPERAAMTNILAFSREQTVREQSGVWMARIDRTLSAAEREELQQWLGSDDRHVRALLDMAALWDRMAILTEIAELFPLQPAPPRWQARLPRALTFACLLLAIVTGLALWLHPRVNATPEMAALDTPHALPRIEADYTTNVGEQRIVRLPDQSIVTLNTATMMRVHYSQADRKVELVRGEAHFQVAKEAARVFTVQVGPNEFLAVGTAFDIRVKSERGIELTVTEGRVQVKSPAAGSAVAQRAGGSQLPTEIMVDAGKVLAIDRAIETVQHLEPAQLETALAWQKGMMVFDAEPLDKAIHEVSRYSNARFLIEDEAAKRIPVSGYFKIGDIDGLIAALSKNFNIDVARNGDVITLSTRRQEAAGSFPR